MMKLSGERVSRPATVAVVLFFCAMAAVAAPPELEDVQQAEGVSPAGLWSVAQGGALFRIEPLSAGSYSLILEDSPDLGLAADTTMGTMTATGNGLQYDAVLKHDLKDGNSKTTMRHYIVQLSDDGNSLTLKHYDKGLKVNVFRWLPYLRGGVTEQDQRPAEADGAIRIVRGSVTTRVL